MPGGMPLLPVEAYTSQEWFDREQERIFSRTWAYAGFKEDLSEPGQYLSVQAGLNNIFVVMGADWRLRAFHNICRHRGTQLIRSVGRAAALRCPYHDWTYDLEGKLVGVPRRAQEFPDFDPSCSSLFPASVGVWRGLIWVHPDLDAPSLAEWFGAVEPHLGPHRVERLREQKRFGITRTKIAPVPNWRIGLQLLRAGALLQRTRGKYEGDPRTDPLASGDFMREDKLVCEQQQRSLRSPRLRHGPSAQVGEQPVRRHQEIVLEWLADGDGADNAPGDAPTHAASRRAQWRS